MNLTQTIKELRAERDKLEKLFKQKLSVIQKALQTLQGLNDVTIGGLDLKELAHVSKRSFISAPALKAHHYKWNYKGVCANPDCRQGPGETPKHFRAKTSRKKYCSHNCTSHAQYLKLLGKPGGMETKAAQAVAAKVPYIRDKNILPKKYKLFCQLPSCGKAFMAAKPWARGCLKHRTTYWRDQMAELPAGMKRTMTASLPPVQSGRPVKLLPGDPLRAGRPDVQ